MKKAIIVLVMMLCAILCACNSEPTDVDIGEEDSQHEDAPANSNLFLESNEPFRMVQKNDITIFGAGDADGYYETLLNWDDESHNIMRTDYATAEQHYLCSRTDCDHRSANCKSFIPPLDNALVFPVPVGDKLAIVYSCEKMRPSDEVKGTTHIDLDGQEW